jgi:hypothetical protein
LVPYADHMLYSLQSEIKHFLKNIWENNVAIELVHAMDYLDMKDQGDGRFSFDNIQIFHSLFPSVFYPAFRLQVQLQRVS